jgi:hypothetical protein
MGKKIALLMILFVFMIGLCLFLVLRANGFPTPFLSKVVYIDTSPKRMVSLYVSDNNKIRSNRIELVSWDEKDNWFLSSMYYVLGGVRLRDHFLYYCDVDRKKIVGYDILTGKGRDLVSDALYPFCVNESGRLFICSTSMKAERERSFKLVDLDKNYVKEFSLPSSFNLFVRPLKLIKGKYILFDSGMYESEGGGPCYFLYDYENNAFVPRENYDEYGDVINSMDRIALYGDTIAYMDPKGGNIGGITQSVNTLYLLDLNMMKSKKLFHDDNVDIQYVAFKDNGRIIEMMGWVAISKKESEGEPSDVKPITIAYDLQTKTCSTWDRKLEIPPQPFPANVSNEIGVYNPNKK